VDEIFPGEKRIPLTTFHLWPQTDAWEDLKALMEKKPWIPEREMINVLNQATEVINFWQESHSTAEAKEQFPGMSIFGTEQIEGDSMDGGMIGELMADDVEGAKDTSAIPRAMLTDSPLHDALLTELPWYRDPNTEGPWDANSGKWKDVSIKTIEDLQKSVPQKMPGMK